jgi:hypothetical protein
VPIEGFTGLGGQNRDGRGETGGPLPPSRLEHAGGLKVSVGCGRKWYRYEEGEESKKCAGEKAGERAEGGDGGVGCGGNSPGNGFPDD